MKAYVCTREGNRIHKAIIILAKKKSLPDEYDDLFYLTIGMSAGDLLIWASFKDSMLIPQGSLLPSYQWYHLSRNETPGSQR